VEEEGAGASNGGDVDLVRLARGWGGGGLLGHGFWDVGVEGADGMGLRDG
jgi:hypothetical protein